MSETEKADIVERLRADVFYGDERLARLRDHNPLHLEAAAEIERLRSVEEDNKQAGEIIIELKREVERLRTELQARRAAEAKAVEVDLPDYLRFGEPDMFPPAQK